MKLYLVQHAKAASKEADPQRALTEEGIQEIRKVAAFIKPLDLSVEYLWHSGKRRAEQSAEFLARVVTTKKEFVIHDGLAPNDDVKIMGNHIISIMQDIMIVGHLPFLSKLASLLLTGNESSDTVAFRNAGLVCLDYTDNQWQVDWFVIPQILV
ncbi:MAG: phosphohistidine phosphatase SixA [Sedimentisphaerales bacterium]|nr:phosphohistidine phosphatase SixA [Sedimentisphaerales bacterium]